jgi:bifunctional non-homologous end joining protein LigD
MGTIEFHGWGARIEDVEKADRLVFDLDPDEGLAFKDVITAAFHLRDLLAEMGLVTFPMVTGGKGVHIIAPLTPQAEWPAVKDFAHRFAMALAQSDPNRRGLVDSPDRLVWLVRSANRPSEAAHQQGAPFQS